MAGLFLIAKSFDANKSFTVKKFAEVLSSILYV